MGARLPPSRWTRRSPRRWDPSSRWHAPDDIDWVRSQFRRSTRDATRVRVTGRDGARITLRYECFGGIGRTSGTTCSTHGGGAGCELYTTAIGLGSAELTVRCVDPFRAGGVLRQLRTHARRHRLWEPLPPTAGSGAGMVTYGYAVRCADGDWLRDKGEVDWGPHMVTRAELEEATLYSSLAEARRAAREYSRSQQFQVLLVEQVLTRKLADRPGNAPLETP